MKRIGVDMADELTKPLTPIDRVAARVVYGEKINYKPTYLRFRLNKKYKKVNVFKIEPKCATKRNNSFIRMRPKIRDKYWEKIEAFTGKKIGRLTVIGKALKDTTWAKRPREFLYVCRCTCSNYIVVRYIDLKNFDLKINTKNGIEMCPECKHLQLLKK